MRCLEAATVRLLCKVSFAEGEDSLAGLGEQLQEGGERQRYSALGLPSLHWSSCIYICFINWSPLWLHLNKSILLLKTWLKSHWFWWCLSLLSYLFSMPNDNVSLERGLNIYLFTFWLFVSQQRMELSLTCFGFFFFFFPKHVPFYFDGLTSFCALLLLFKPQNCYFTPSLGTGMLDTISNKQSNGRLERKTLWSLKSRNGCCFT